jgi:Zn-dependent protease with chaperone function
MNPNHEKPTFGASNPALRVDHDSNWHEVLSWLLGVTVLGLALYWGAGLLSNVVARKISDDQEARWFSAETVLNASGFKPESGESVVDFKRCQTLLASLISANNLRKLPFNLYYSSSLTPNAFAAPGGSVMVTQGLLDLVKSDMGLAMVLAHELGHHQYRDPLRGLGRKLLLSLTIGILTGGDSGVAQFVLGMMENSYSRDQELRADRFGFELVRSTFNRTAGALEFFEKMAEHETSKIHQLTSMISTHPYTPDRINALKELERSKQTPQP